MNTTINKIDSFIPDLLINPRFRICRHLFLQVIILFITLNVFWDTPDHFIFTPGRLYSWITYYGMFNFLIYFNKYYLAPRFLLAHKTTGYIGTVLILITIGVLTIGILQGVLTGTEETPNPVNNRNVFLSITSSILSVGFVIAGVSASLIFINWIIYSKRINELESATLESELKILKNQINPHFLFNMLNNANYLIMDNRQEASEVLLKLEDLLRYQLNDTSREKVSLSADIHFLNDFLNLEKFRRDDFEYVITKEGDINNIEVPPFLFIPFVENAVKHSQDGETASFIHISFKTYGKILEFVCENTKPPVIENQEEKPGGIGLKNIQRRLDLLFPGQYKLITSEDEFKYTVKLQLNL